MKLISIIFSFKNEEGNLEELVSRTSNVLEKIENWNYSNSVYPSKYPGA